MPQSQLQNIVEQRVRVQIGDLIITNHALSVEVEMLRAQVADLTTQVAELSKKPEIATEQKDAKHD